VTITYQTLATTTATLGSTPNPSTFGQPVTFTATVSCPGFTPTGTVTFRDGATVLGSGTLLGGVASFTTSSLAVGSHSITAAYPGDTNCAAGTSNTVTQVVNAVASGLVLSASPNPSAIGQPVTFTATVSCPGFTPTGTVTFRDGGTLLGSGTLSSGMATFTTSSLTSGSHPITASYPGDVNCAASTSNTVTQVVNAAAPPAPGVSTLNLTSTPNPSFPGQAVTFTAAVSCTNPPTGTVTFQDGSTVLGSAAVSNGQASISTTFATGTHSITAAYSGDSRCAAASGALSEVVGISPILLALLLNPPAAAPAAVPAPAPAAVPSSGIIIYAVTGGPGTVLLAAGCNTVVVSTPAGTPLAALAALVQPAGLLANIWRFSNSLHSWQAGYFAGGGPTDFSTTGGGTEAYAFCVNGPGTIG
jgi:hypothetical protein